MNPQLLADLSHALVQGFIAAFVCGLLAGFLISLLWERYRYYSATWFKPPAKSRKPRKPRASKPVVDSTGDMFFEQTKRLDEGNGLEDGGAGVAHG